MPKPCRYVLATVLFWATTMHVDARTLPLCERFSTTPLGARVDLFADPMPTFETGQILPSSGAFAVKLKPAKRVVYPYKSPNDHDAGKGAILAIEYVPAGLVRISFSDPAALDAVQGNQLLPQKPVRRAAACPGIGQSVEIQSSGGPLILQLSGADTELLKILVIPIPAGDAGTAGSIRSVSNP